MQAWAEKWCKQMQTAATCEGPVTAKYCLWNAGPYAEVLHMLALPVSTVLLALLLLRVLAPSLFRGKGGAGGLAGRLVLRARSDSIHDGTPRLPFSEQLHTLFLATNRLLPHGRVNDLILPFFFKLSYPTRLRSLIC